MFRGSILSLVAVCALSLAPGCKDGGSTDTSGAEVPPPPPPPPPPTATGTIAYARGGEIRLVEPDGSNDRALWAAPRPDLNYTVHWLVWRPDGGELAFSSDHEEATSFWERDIYALSADGTRLRKLTNGPAHDALAALPKGTVTVRVQNNTADGGPFIIYVAGAAEPQSALIAPASSKTLTFTNVADFGNGVQMAVAILGSYRWYGAAAADVKSGSTVSAGTLTITPLPLEHLGAEGPGWRSDGSKVAFISGARTCGLYQVPASPPAGAIGDPLLDPDFKGLPCAYDYAPASRAGQLLAAETDFGQGQGAIYQIAEGSGTRGPALVTYESYAVVMDLRWLPDGSGFLFSAHRYGSVFNENANLYEYSFATKAVRQLTRFESEFIRGFSISPDGQRIALERASAADAETSDLWVMRRDGSDLHRVAQNARYPAWNPKRP